MSDTPSDLVQRLLEKAKAKGADQADALIYNATGQDIAVRMGLVEEVERTESRDLGLRVFVGNRPAVVSSNDWSEDVLDQLVERAVAMAKIAPEDPYAGLAAAERLIKDIPDLDLDDGHEPSVDKMTEMAKEAEDAARAVTGVTNSEGAGAGYGHSEIVLATSHGFLGSYKSSSHSLSASVIAGEGTAMERDYDYDSTRHFTDLRSANDIGRRAGELAVRRLNPRKVETQQVPVIYDERVSRGILGHFLGAINGSSVARGTSFLKDRMGEMVFNDRISIVENPLRKRGMSSKPFDGEGVATQEKVLVENGHLKTWLLDSATAKQLSLETTGNASRGTAGGPSPSSTNVHMEAGSMSPQDLIKSIGTGFYVTEMIGMGVNGVTGDYSRGASGFWIENGELAFPVSEITLAGNLKEMFQNLTPANDLVFRYGTNVPTLLIEGMTLAGA